MGCLDCLLGDHERVREQSPLSAVKLGATLEHAVGLLGDRELRGETGPG